MAEAHVYLQPGANVEATDTFASWVETTNMLVYDMGTKVVTTAPYAQPNTTVGGYTTGNSHIEGRFSANALIASTELRGGTVSGSANLIVSSNTIFNESALVQVGANTNLLNIDANNMVISSNVTFDGGATKIIVIDVANTTVNTGSFYVKSNTAFSGVTANVNTTSLNVTANATFSGANVLITSTNTTIGDAGTDRLTINAVSDFNANVNIDGILTQTANAVFTGANVQIDSALTTIGNAITDLLVVNSYLNSDLIPNATTIDLGSDAKPYGNVHTTYVWSDNNIETQGNVVIKGSATRILKTLSTTTSQQALNVVLENSAAATFTPLVANTSGIHAGANTTYDLGSATINWRNIYVKDAAVANSAVISNVLTVNAQANTASLMVRDLTATRIPYVGTAGEIVDSANLTFSGTGVSITGTLAVSSNETVGGTLGVTGAITVSNTLSVTGASTLANTLNVAGITTLTANLDLQDNNSILIGTGDDLRIYHDGSNSYITEQGIGGLYIRSTAGNISIQTSSSENAIVATQDGAVALYFNNSEKITTTNTGVSLTGILAVSGNETVGGTLDVTGATTIANTVAVTGASTFANTVGITGASTFANTVGITGTATFSNNAIFADNRAIIMGTSEDLMIYHDGLHSYVSDLGTGNLKLDASQLDIQTSNSTATETMATFVRDGAVTLYHDNSVRIATSATGASVTGALAVSGNETIGGTLGVTGASTLAGMSATTGTFSSTLGVSGTTTAAAINASGLVSVTNTTDATSTTTAALKTAGGLAVAKKLYIGDQTFASANVTISGAGNYITTPGANVTNNFQVGGTATIVNLTVTGSTTLNTDSQLSLNNATTAHSTITDDITLTNATIIGNVVPDANNTYDIGGSTTVWKTLYANNVVANVAWSSVTDKPDPVVTVTLSGDVAGSGNATLTDLANGTVSIATTIQPNSVALGTDTTGNYVGTLAAGTPSTQSGTSGLTISAASGEDTAATIAHADTSSVSNISIDNSNGTVIQDIALGFDTFGHVTSASAVSVNLDLRYPQSAFTNIAVSGQSTIQADSLTDTLTFVGSGIAAITTNATSDTVTITATETDTLQTVTNRGNTTTNSITVNDLNANNVVISGNLTVSGTTTYVNTTNLDIGDNIITLNADYTGATPTENAGIEIERGTLANTSLLWNETTDRWTFTNNGTTYYNIPISTEYDKYTSWTIRDGDTTTYTITSGDTLQIASGTGITSNFTADDVLTITNTDTGSSQNIFKNIAVSGQTSVVADSNNDTLTFAGSGTVSITTDAGTDTVTITGAATNLGYDANTTFGTVTSSTGTNATIPAANSTVAGLVTTGNQTITGTKTFSSTITGDISGNAATAAQVNSTLTRGSYLTGNNFNGSAATSWAVDATTTNTASKVVARDASGNFAAGTITAALSGNATTATTLATGRNINGVSFNGSQNIEVGDLRHTTGALIIDGTAQSVPVNYLQVRAANTTQDVLLTTAGSDANIDLLIQTKGTGSITLDTGTSTGVIDLKPGSSNLRIWDNTSTHYHEVITGDPTANRTISLPNANVTLVSGTMVPTTGTGATGSWGISVTGSSGSTTGNAATVTNGVYTSGDQTIAGVKTFSSTISGSITGNAGTVTGGVYTSGNQTIADTKTFSSTITGSITGNAGTVTGGVYTSGDQTIAGVKTFSSNIVAPGISRTGDFTIDASGDIILDAQGNQIYFYDAGVQRGYLGVGAADTISLYTGASTLNTTFAGANLTCSGDITSSSDARLKENVVTVDSALDKVSNLRGVYYNKIGETERKLGVIAQEVEAVIPEVVSSDIDGMKSVAYANMVGLLIEAIKELKAEINELKSNK